MNEELKEKLKSVLADNGIDEGIQDKILVELEGEPKEEEPPVSDLPPVEEDKGTEALAQDEPLPEEGAVPPLEGEATEVPPELPPEVPPTDVPPVPVFDKEAYDHDMEELRKTNEALLARVDSLEEALRNAGVIEGEKKEQGFGFHKDNAPDKDPVEDGLDGFLARANRKSY